MMGAFLRTSHTLTLPAWRTQTAPIATRCTRAARGPAPRRSTCARQLLVMEDISQVNKSLTKLMKNLIRLIQNTIKSLIESVTKLP